ncbi:unnamed protein product [Oikopleura dioica]|uniref:Uncharacterized protein n=1 Tax=Oikopleura dioica TaxID=34765 RepID=E4XJB3_OIKDI|nr:unnamed protein product [Oikopleura dioica]
MMGNVIKQDPADFIFFVTQDQYDAEVRLARRNLAKRKRKEARDEKCEDEATRSPIRTRSVTQVARQEPIHAYGCALQIIKAILTKRPRDLRRNTTFLAQADLVRENSYFKEFFSRRTPLITSFTND